MIIEEPEVFKAWLIDKLKVLCDAEPEALAKYVYALAKKDKPLAELKETMIQQLEVFLNETTANFVTVLINTISDKTYLTSSTPAEEKPAPNAETAEVVKTEQTEAKADLKTDVKTESRLPSAVVEKSSSDTSSKLKRKHSFSPEHKTKYSRTKRRSSSSSGSKSRSRSRSKSKSRSRSRSRSRSWSYEHRHSYRRNRSYRNWSPEHPKRTRTIRKSPPNHSKSPIDYKKGSWHTLADWEKPVSPGGTIIQRNLNHPPPRFNGPPPNIYAKKCADFEEKGFCMKGDLCMFDHGTDPVVLDNVDSVPFSLPVQPDVLHPSGPDSLYANPMVNLQGPLLGPPPSNLEYNPAAPNMEPWPPSNYIGGPFNNRGPLNKQRELISVPTSAKAGLQDFTRSDSLQKPKSFNQQNIPTNSLLLKKIPTHLNNISRLNNHFYKFGRINKIQVFYEGQPDAALITFSSVAEAQAAYRSPEPILNNRFIKMFYYQTDKSLVNGKIQDSIANKRNVGNTSAVNMQLNRPKVPETSNGATPKQVDSTTTFQKTGAYNLVKDPGRKPVVEKLNVLKKTVTIYKKKQELLQKLIKQQKDLILLIEKGSLSEEQRSKIFETISSLQVQIEGIKESIKEAQADMSKTASLIKSKPGTQLVKSEPKVKTEPVEQSEAAEKVEIKGESSDADSAEKPSAENQSDSKASKENEADSSQPQKKQALTEMQRKILDLKKQMQALTDSKTLAQSLKKPFFNNPNKFSRNLTFTRNPTAPETTKKNVFALSNPTTTAPAQPSKFPAAANVDHRPTKLLISGYEYDDETELLQNLAAFGEIEDYISDPTTPSIIVSYKTRKEAEIALVKGKMFKDRKLSIMWYNEPVPYKAMKRTLSCSSDHSTDKSFQDDITSPDHYSYSRKFDSSHEDDSDCDRKSDRDIDEKLDLKSDSSQREFDWNRLSH
nr:PREDICTED: RNA-binding protein 26-like [Bemisia tabaci]